MKRKSAESLAKIKTPKVDHVDLNTTYDVLKRSAAAKAMVNSLIFIQYRGSTSA